jgi:hypothetical protein
MEEDYKTDYCMKEESEVSKCYNLQLDRTYKKLMQSDW